MISFQSNFFFIKFAVLFFILTIFGYWGVDLNSEELYIAFSFFLLVIVGVVVFRQAILLVFVQASNVKYFRLLSDLLVAVGALTVNVVELKNLYFALESLATFLLSYATFMSKFLKEDACVLLSVSKEKLNLFQAFLPLSLNFYFSNILRLKKFNALNRFSANFFSITVN